MAILFSASTGFSFNSTMNTGEILESNRYRFSTETQYITQGENLGANIISRFDFNVNRDSNIRLQAGTGAISYQTGAYYTWVPIPNYVNQPALGGIFGMSYHNDDNTKSVYFSAAPIISQKIALATTESILYASLPFGVASKPEKSHNFLQLNLGSEFKIKRFANITLSTEMGVNLYKSSSYISVGANFYFNNPRALF